MQNAIVIDPLAVHEDKLRPLLEKRLEGIVSEAAWMADSSCTRDHHREHIITECNAVRQALQSLLLEYMSNVSYYILLLILYKVIIRVGVALVFISSDVQKYSENMKTSVV